MHLRFTRFLLCCLLVCAGSITHATHYRGGEIGYRYLGNNQYEISVTIYADCHGGDPSAIQQDLPLFLGIFRNNGVLVSIDTTLSGPVQKQELNFIPGCFSDNNHYCGQFVTMKRTIMLPPTSSGYKLINPRCCLGARIANLQDPSSQGVSIHGKVAALAAGNSSPIRNAQAPLRMCINTPYSIDFGGVDPDGDSLVYRLEPALAGGTASNAKPLPYTNNPNSVIYFSPNYSYDRPLGNNGTMLIDSRTGVLSGYCSTGGEYLIAVACDEYRNGQLIGSVSSVSVLEFADCHKETTAQIQRDSILIEAGIDTVSIVRCGANRTVQLQNTSKGAQRYHWDFGVTASNSDTSTVTNPFFTYPSAGNYQVRLIAYGANCNDTLYTRAWISDDVLQADFSYSDKHCLQDTVELNDTSTSSGSAIRHFIWQTNSLRTYGATSSAVLLQQGQQQMSHFVVSEGYCVAGVDKYLPVDQGYVYAGADTTVIRNTPLVLTASGANSYTWSAMLPASFQDYKPGAASQQVHTGFRYKDLQFIVRGDNNNSCPGFDTVLVTVSEGSYVFVPSAFTPNGDGKNDVLRPRISGANLESFKVFNRRGNLVYSSTSVHDSWDGTYKGEEAAMATYYWMAVLKVDSIPLMVYKGDVLLVR